MAMWRRGGGVSRYLGEAAGQAIANNLAADANRPVVHGRQTRNAGVAHQLPDTPLSPPSIDPAPTPGTGLGGPMAFRLVAHDPALYKGIPVPELAHPVSGGIEVGKDGLITVKEGGAQVAPTHMGGSYPYHAAPRKGLRTNDL